MLRRAILAGLGKTERDLGYDLAFVRDVLEADLAAFLRLARLRPFSEYRRDVPAEVWHATRLAAVLTEDCGPCAQLVDDSAAPPDRALELADDVSFALLMLLERLSPLERTSFLLHDVFGMEFEAVAQVLERSAASCRKLADRAREHVQEGRPRFDATAEDEVRLADAFMHASGSGDVAALAQLEPI